MSGSEADDEEKEESRHEIVSTDVGESYGNVGEGAGLSRSVSGITRRLNNLTIVSHSMPDCTYAHCNLGASDSKFMLECKKCSKLHYSCTQLPPYQIALFMRKDYRLYVCCKCVGDVHEDIQDNCQTSTKTDELKQLMVDNNRLKNDIESKCDIIKSTETAQNTLRHLIDDKDEMILIQNNIIDGLQKCLQKGLTIEARRGSSNYSTETYGTL